MWEPSPRPSPIRMGEGGRIVEESRTTLPRHPAFLMLDDVHAQCSRQGGGLGGGDGDVFELGWGDGD